LIQLANKALTNIFIYYYVVLSVRTLNAEDDKMRRINDAQWNWLKTLRIGSPVGIESDDNRDGYKITTVKSIDERGRIKVEGQCDFVVFTDGEYDSGCGIGRMHYWLVPITAEVREDVHRQELIRKIKSIDLETLSTGRLEALVGLLE
jgi:hypothetical protein